MQIRPGLSPRAVGLAAALITVFIWSAFIVIARASVKGALSPFDLGLARITGASLALVPVGIWLNRRRPSSAGSSFFGLSPLPLRLTVACGLFGGFGYAALSYSGFFFAPATHASVLLPGSLPLWTAMLAVIVLGERLSGSRLLGLVLIVTGGLFVGGASLLGAFRGGEVWKGDLLFMSAAISWSAYSVLVRKHGLEAVRVTTAITVFALFSYVPLYALLLWAGVLHSKLASAPVGQVLFHMAFQGLGSVVISGITFTMMIKHFGPVRSTMITSLVPGLSALGAVVLLGEPLYWNLIGGLACVTAGILFGIRRAPK